MIASIRTRGTLVLARRFVVTAAVAAALVLTIGIGKAHAHAAELVGTYSAYGQAVVVALPRVVVLFDAPVQSAEMTVRGEDGRRSAVVSAALSGSEAGQGVALVAHGSDHVSWRVVSDDAHPRTGDFTFPHADPAAPRSVAVVSLAVLVARGRLRGWRRG